MSQEIVKVLNQHYKNLPAERVNMMKPTIRIMGLTASGNMNELRQEISLMKINNVIDRPNIKTLINSGLKKSVILKIIDMHLTRFQMLINISEPMNELQIEDFSFSFLEEYSHESIEDFVLFLNYIQKGYFGVIYNRLDKTVLFEYFSKYLDMKSQERESIAQSQKNDSETPIMPMAKKEKEEFYKKGIEFLERQKKREKENRSERAKYNIAKTKWLNSKANVKTSSNPGESSAKQKQSGKKENTDLDNR